MCWMRQHREKVGLECARCGSGNHWAIGCQIPSSGLLSESTDTSGTNASGRLAHVCSGIADAMDQVMEAYQDISVAIDHIDANAESEEPGQHNREPRRQLRRRSKRSKGLMRVGPPHSATSTRRF